MLMEVTGTANGFFTGATVAMEEVIEGRPWLFQGQPIVLQKWEPGRVLLHRTTSLSDAITQAWTRLDFTRVCVMLDINTKLSKHLVIMTPTEVEGREIACKVDLKYVVAALEMHHLYEPTTCHEG
ncbi:UNVERIFIED_CONTAM: hypothetical protein Sindi_0477000, partial [Sesamum indicum]